MTLIPSKSTPVLFGRKLREGRPTRELGRDGLPKRAIVVGERQRAARCEVGLALSVERERSKQHPSVRCS